MDLEEYIGIIIVVIISIPIIILIYSMSQHQEIFNPVIVENNIQEITIMETLCNSDIELLFDNKTIQEYNGNLKYTYVCDGNNINITVYSDEYVEVTIK